MNEKRLFKKLVKQLKHSFCERDNMQIKVSLAKLSMLQVDKKTISKCRLILTLDHYIIEYPDQHIRTSAMALKNTIKRQFETRTTTSKKALKAPTPENPYPLLTKLTEKLRSQDNPNRDEKQTMGNKRKREVFEVTVSDQSTPTPLTKKVVCRKRKREEEVDVTLCDKSSPRPLIQEVVCKKQKKKAELDATPCDESTSRPLTNQVFSKKRKREDESEVQPRKKFKTDCLSVTHLISEFHFLHL